ncbi:MAG: hypothetical protein MK108_06285 [Mariniblastus sp.]|nr:hypothetical protein [Mariniblastus sp.]
MKNSQSPFTDVDLTIENYRPFSILSLACLLLAALAGIITIVKPSLIFGSVAMAVFASAILIWLHPQRQKLLGYRLAGIALFISLFVVAASIAYQQYRLVHLQNTAVRFCNEFLDLAKQGRMHELYQLTLNYDNRAKPGESLVERYGTLTSPGPELDMYLKQEPELSLRQDGDQAELNLLLKSYIEREIYKEKFMIGFKYNRPDGEARYFSMFLMRLDYPEPHGPQWYVYNITNYQPSIPRNLTQQQQGVESMPDDM